jgi:hypothetical protein
MMLRVSIGFPAVLAVLLATCSDGVGPEEGDLVKVVATSPSFTFTLDDLGREEGEVEVTNLNDVPLYVFSACGNPEFRLQE